MNTITQAQYEFALARIEELLPLVREDTPANDRNAIELTMMSDIVIGYEKEHFPIEVPSLVATMNSRMEEHRWTQKELAAILGITAPRLNAILNGKVNPTYEQARIISARLDIDPAIVLAL